MNLKLLELDHRKGEALPFQTTLEPVELKRRHQELRGLSPVEVKGEASKQGNLYYIAGEMDADADFVCARCLQKFQIHMNVPFQEVFTASAEVAAQDQDGETFYVEGDEIELTPILEEDFLLEVPTVPLCRDDCKGLCPECGANRNETPCSCRTERIDPRWADLANFFAEEDK